MVVPSFDGALTPTFFERDPVVVARDLLGRLLVRRILVGGERSAVVVTRVVETEAYDCPRDPSCHVIERLPGAKEVLAGPPGRYYFHRSYEHRLLNVVCGPVGHDAAILVRAVEVLHGEALLRERRPVKRAVDLTNGPAKLVTALGLDDHFTGRPVNHPEAYFASGETVPDDEVTTTTRVGLTRGTSLPWRFLVTGNPWVSKGRESGRER